MATLTRRSNVMASLMTSHDMAWCWMKRGVRVGSLGLGLRGLGPRCRVRCGASGVGVGVRI